MEKTVFIFQCPSVLISAKKAASGADNPNWFTQGDVNFSLFHIFLHLEWVIFQLFQKLQY